MIVAIRHGPVAADGICYGRWNPPLVNEPQADADTIHAALAGLGGILQIVSSPADRCRAVADRLAPRLGLTVREDPRIAELSMGDWEGKAWQWIEEHDGERLQRWMEQWQEAAPPGGESLADLDARVRAAATDADHGGPTLWITHAGVIRTLRVWHHSVAWPAAMQSRVPHLAPEPFLGGGDRRGSPRL
ncbi:MAG: histidine phosphatase family protein [Planctomycetia bacterium]